MHSPSLHSFRWVALAAATLAVGCAAEEPMIRPSSVDPQLIAQSRKDFTTSLTETRNTSIKVKDQASLTITALDRLIDEKQTDLRSSFDSFSKAVAGLDTEAASMKNIVGKLRSDGQKFLSHWEQDLASMANEDVREQGQSRHKEIVEVFTDAQSDLDKSLGSLNDLQVLVGDMKTYLGNTLSSEGVEQMSKPASEASKASKTLTGLIDSANEAIDKVLKELPSPNPSG